MQKLELFKRLEIMKNTLNLNWLTILCLIALINCSKTIEPETEQTDDPIDQTYNPVSSTNENQPNILFIIADDLGIDAVPRYPFGDRKAVLPTLEQLMDEGIRFTNVWTNPICSPTRASILTGKYGYRTGVLNAEEAGRIDVNERTLHSKLNEITDSPYSTSIIGKWHLSARNTPNRPQEMGIGHYAGLYTGGVDDYNAWSLNVNGESSNQTSYITTAFTDMAIEWIDAQEKPWFCWLAYTTPHSPFHLPPTNMHSQGGLSENITEIQANPLPYYLAMIESLDYEINRLLTSLSPAVRENTIIVFLGDNGSPGQVAQSPYNRNKAKGSLYQGGVHVPMIISGAGVNRIGIEENALITSVDLHNTFLEIAGLNVDEGIDSQSFYTLLNNGITGQRSFNYTEVLGDRENQSGHTIANEKYKLIVFDDGNQEYYNLIDDPEENNNLFDLALSSEATTVLNQLNQELSNIRR